MSRPTPSAVRAVRCLGTTLAFTDAVFQVSFRDGQIHIERDASNRVVVTPRHATYGSESGIEGGLVLSEAETGSVGYRRYFDIEWDDELTLPTLTFNDPPTRIERKYDKGDAVELGLEEVSEYHLVYADGVEAWFRRTDASRFEFSFSTGFRGAFWQDPDESYTLTFKGDRLKPTEEARRSQSKFLVSRSKYSGNLLLVLQEAATVSVR
jgi:hypothetical protein